LIKGNILTALTALTACGIRICHMASPTGLWLEKITTRLTTLSCPGPGLGGDFSWKVEVEAALDF
jgi:hypothetical protein